MHASSAVLALLLVLHIAVTDQIRPGLLPGLFDDLSNAGYAQRLERRLETRNGSIFPETCNSSCGQKVSAMEFDARKISEDVAGNQTEVRSSNGRAIAEQFKLVMYGVCRYHLDAVQCVSRNEQNCSIVPHRSPTGNIDVDPLTQAIMDFECFCLACPMLVVGYGELLAGLHEALALSLQATNSDSKPKPEEIEEKVLRGLCLM
eukprot:TRINITY_DN33790_c0_g1_i1.p1 TRINITY_DN33790_c0_g1~~TRINITY_DN33790_c0_g1_i1.p1  ORF type:complete len:204 (-),score=30.75 TRINITY_DN33790_c0_g1_i1:126-737(-)